MNERLQLAKPASHRRSKVGWRDFPNTLQLHYKIYENMTNLLQMSLNVERMRND